MDTDRGFRILCKNIREQDLNVFLSLYRDVSLINDLRLRKEEFGHSLRIMRVIRLNEFLGDRPNGHFGRGVVRRQLVFFDRLREGNHRHDGCH